MHRLRKILLVSALPPSHSAGLGQSVIDSLSAAGYQVDVLTKYGYIGQPKNITNVLKQSPKQLIINWMRSIRLFAKIVNVLKIKFEVSNKIFNRITNDNRRPNRIQNNGILFVYPEEENPNIPINILLSKIKSRYDAVITLFWEDFITTESLKYIYNKLKCPIIIYSVDMAPMTGGCYYFGDCRNFIEGCGNCPAINSCNKHDLSSKNYEIKKRNYSQMDVVYLGNTWMNDFALKSGLFRPDCVQYASIVLNKDIFSPAKSEKDMYDIPDDKEFVILFRFSGFKSRKGDEFLVEILNHLYDKLNTIERKSILLLSVGMPKSDDTKISFKFDYMNLGRVTIDDLIKAYRTASVFISPSIDDAGPSMVNQSMMCATPVLAFKVGTAIDMIQDNESGYISDIDKRDKFVDNLVTLIRDKEKLTEMSAKARESALMNNSFESFSNKIKSIIQQRQLTSPKIYS